MAELNVQFVRPDRALYEGPAASLLLATYTGEMGIYPGHAAEIVALGDGVVRMMLTEAEGGGIRRVVVSGGYAEVDNDQVIILADHARRTDDIEPETVRRTRDEVIRTLESCEEGDPRRAYYENKINWCNLLLKHVVAEDQ